MFKKSISFALAIILLLNTQIIAFSLEDNKQNDKKGGLEVSAPYAILTEQNTGEVLWAKNENEKTAPASIVKIMVMILVMEAIDSGSLSLDEMVTTSEHASSMGGSQIWLKPTEEMTVDEMIKAVTVQSANDAAVALAEKISGSEEAFVEKMNQKATEIGMKNTLFKSASGLDEEDQYTCAADVAIMANYLMNYEKIKDYSTIWIEYLRNGDTQLVNTNKMIKSYDGATGLKTGTTELAGHCVCATATKGDLELTAVVMGCKTPDERWNDAKAILNMGFANYDFYKPRNIDDELLPVRVHFGTVDYAEIYCDYAKGAVIKKEEKDKIKEEIVLTENLEAPLDHGTTVGKVILSTDTDTILEYPIRIRDNIEKRTVFKALGALWKELLQMK